MPDAFEPLGLATHPSAAMAAKLIAAMAFGVIVAWVYTHTRAERASSFSVTLVMLAILIAMVTQVIGDNVARAFSLVGALSIVRFRTVVRDTQDTAFVIFAVAVGMAAGAGNVWLAAAGLAVTSATAVAMRTQPHASEPFQLVVRLGLGLDATTVLGATLDTYLLGRRLVGVATARQGAAIEVSYRVTPRDARAVEALVTALNRVEGVQSVALQAIPDSPEP